MFSVDAEMKAYDDQIAAASNLVFSSLVGKPCNRQHGVVHLVRSRHRSLDFQQLLFRIQLSIPTVCDCS